MRENTYNLNIECGKYINETTVNFNVPREIEIDGIKYMGDLRYRMDLLSTLNFFQVVDSDENPELPDEGGWHLEPRYLFDEVHNEIVRSYVAVEDPPRNLSISKRKLMNGLKALGCWDQVKAYLESTGAWEDFSLATTLDEQEELMQRAIAALKLALGLSDKQIDALLEGSVAD